MSDFQTTARPYSRAIFELASEQDALTYWSDVLALAAVVASDKDLLALIASPSMLNAELATLFVSILKAPEGAPEITKEVENMVALLAENDRLSLFPAIALGFEVLKQESMGTIEVQVTSAQKLTAKQEKEMAKNLKVRLGKEVSITAEIDKSLIAGAIIKAGDLVIDGSARGRLNKLTSTLNK
jgi:F-type H+-transporting ATPase subunit delta